MWKDYLHYTKGEARAAIALLVLILGAAFFILFLSQNGDTEPVDQVALLKFQEEVKAFESSQRIVRRMNYYPPYSHKRNDFAKSELFPFDPNTADSLTFLRLGLKPFMARMILKYRMKGGRYRTPADFSKVPYLDKVLFTKLTPFIRIDQKLVARTDTFIRKAPSFVKQEKLTEGESIDLASADTFELKKIPGVGSGIARAIVNYRNRLGGFYSVNQLQELKNIGEESFVKIAKFTQIHKSNIVRIAVNKSSIERLMAHPYLNFYQAKAIVELRKKKGKVVSLDEFSLYDEFSARDFDRLRYYLDFTL